MSFIFFSLQEPISAPNNQLTALVLPVCRADFSLKLARHMLSTSESDLILECAHRPSKTDYLGGNSSVFHQ